MKLNFTVFGEKETAYYEDGEGNVETQEKGASKLAK